MKKLQTILLIAMVFIYAETYKMTITVETESIKSAGKVEEIIKAELKEYKPKIKIETQENIIKSMIIDSVLQVQPKLRLYDGKIIIPNVNCGVTED